MFFDLRGVCTLVNVLRNDSKFVKQTENFEVSVEYNASEYDLPDVVIDKKNKTAVIHISKNEEFDLVSAYFACKSNDVGVCLEFLAFKIPQYSDALVITMTKLNKKLSFMAVMMGYMQIYCKQIHHSKLLTYVQKKSFFINFDSSILPKPVIHYFQDIIELEFNMDYSHEKSPERTTRLEGPWRSKISYLDYIYGPNVCEAPGIMKDMIPGIVHFYSDDYQRLYCNQTFCDVIQNLKPGKILKINCPRVKNITNFFWPVGEKCPNENCEKKNAHLFRVYLYSNVSEKRIYTGHMIKNRNNITPVLFGDKCVDTALELGNKGYCGLCINNHLREKDSTSCSRLWTKITVTYVVTVTEAGFINVKTEMPFTLKPFKSNPMPNPMSFFAHPSTFPSHPILLAHGNNKEQMFKYRHDLRLKNMFNLRGFDEEWCKSHVDHPYDGIGIKIALQAYAHYKDVELKDTDCLKRILGNEVYERISDEGESDLLSLNYNPKNLSTVTYKDDKSEPTIVYDGEDILCKTAHNNKYSLTKIFALLRTLHGNRYNMMHVFAIVLHVLLHFQEDFSKLKSRAYFFDIGKDVQEQSYQITHPINRQRIHVEYTNRVISFKLA